MEIFPSASRSYSKGSLKEISLNILKIFTETASHYQAPYLLFCFFIFHHHKHHGGFTVKKRNPRLFTIKFKFTSYTIFFPITSNLLYQTDTPIHHFLCSFLLLEVFVVYQITLIMSGKLQNKSKKKQTHTQKKAQSGKIYSCSFRDHTSPQ